MGSVRIDKMPYRGWPNSISMSDGRLDLIATTDIGPRIIWFGFSGGRNELYEVPEDIGKTGGTQHRLYGGHRLWHAPQDDRRTLELDNSPVEYRIEGETLILRQPVEPWAMIEKEMRISFLGDSGRLRILHKLTNRGAWQCTLSLWALTLVAPGGMEVIPLSSRDTSLAPNRTLAFWKWTDLRDPKLSIGRSHILVKQIDQSRCADPQGAQDIGEKWARWSHPLKLGLNNEDGWAAYANNGHLFVLRFAPQPGGAYPDGGSSFETFSCDQMTEMETLTPLTALGPDESIEHAETWELHDSVRTPEGEGEVETSVLPIILKGSTFS